MAYDHQFIQDFWKASPEQAKRMYEQHPERVVSAQMLKKVSTQASRELGASSHRHQQLQGYDRDYNSGRESSDTYHHKRHLAQKQGSVDQVKSDLQKIRNDWSSSPEQKALADKELKRLAGRRH